MPGTRAAHKDKTDKHKRKHRVLFAAIAATAGLAAGAVGISTAMGAIAPTSHTSHTSSSRHSSTDPDPASKPLHRTAPAPLASTPHSDKNRGMVYDGLITAPKGDRCVGAFRVVDSPLCTHGPDAPPKGVDIHKDTPPAVKADPGALSQDGLPTVDVSRGGTRAAGSTPVSAPGSTAAPSAVACDGDGKQGNRVQVLYLHAPGQDRFAQYLPSFRKWAADADLIYSESAKETGGTRHIRFVTEPGCKVSVLNVEISADALRDFGASNQALGAKGFNRHDRKYMVYADSQVYCGIGTLNGDERPGADNQSNFGPSYGRSDSGCWNGSVSAHELGHNLGAVNNSAPHTSKGGHCVDEWDIMCYSDSPNHPQMQILCPERGHDQRLDCNHDDYYNTSPKPGSYLTTHWNVANNKFLIAGKGQPADPKTGPKAKASRITTNAALLKWQPVDSARSYDVRLNGRSIGKFTSTAVLVKGLKPDTSYKVTIVVRDSGGHASKPGPATTFRTKKS
ncbi:fibronectin type III domain-containing protein [Wenjunlia tyrosinilytica]|uniref:Fibronectin type-III domain-containing protein n=1 Tax=Wenjunlia tyrosinilytica TaxID=1544741 RepID=A0A918DQZ4_9ACTN|nr:hypothetical protein [Wenjunlia tyrosinilytica]GGO80066.1 hypothetical protein GCM10012280_01050 [Wenjunlia tyrosinilytica]